MSTPTNMDELYLVTVSGMFNSDYAISGIEPVSGGLRPIPYNTFLDWETANALKKSLEADYPAYSFKLVQVQG